MNGVSEWGRLLTREGDIRSSFYQTILNGVSFRFEHVFSRHCGAAPPGGGQRSEKWPSEDLLPEVRTGADGSDRTPSGAPKSID